MREGDYVSGVFKFKPGNLDYCVLCLNQSLIRRKIENQHWNWLRGPDLNLSVTYHRLGRAVSCTKAPLGLLVDHGDDKLFSHDFGMEKYYKM